MVKIVTNSYLKKMLNLLHFGCVNLSIRPTGVGKELSAVKKCLIAKSSYVSFFKDVLTA